MQNAGYERCRQSGYRGRIALYETLPATRPIVEAILHRADAATLTAIAEGMRPLAAEGARLAVEGRTSLEEVFRAVALAA